MKVESAMNSMALEFHQQLLNFSVQGSSLSEVCASITYQSQPIAHTVVSTNRAQYSRMNLKEINSS